MYGRVASGKYWKSLGNRVSFRFAVLRSATKRQQKLDTGTGVEERRTPRRRRKMQRVTMTDVAKLAQVSPSTVSLFLRRPDGVSPAAGQTIARAIEALGYVPNPVAGGLAAAS